MTATFIADPVPEPPAESTPPPSADTAACERAGEKLKRAEKSLKKARKADMKRKHKVGRPRSGSSGRRAMAQACG